MYQDCLNAITMSSFSTIYTKNFKIEQMIFLNEL